jgi:hypothetical protein
MVTAVRLAGVLGPGEKEQRRAPLGDTRNRVGGVSEAKKMEPSRYRAGDTLAVPLTLNRHCSAPLPVLRATKALVGVARRRTYRVPKGSTTGGEYREAPRLVCHRVTTPGMGPK